MDYRTRYPRLRFGDGGTLDLDERVQPWDQPAFEERWRLVSVHVEWLLSPKGRLDRALSYVTSPVKKSPDSSAS